MHYRRLSYRYMVVLARDDPQSLSDIWRSGQPYVTLAHPRWRPATDVYETTSMLTIMVELAGVDQETLDILLYEDAVVIEGARRLPQPEEAGVFHAAEIQQGPFRLAVRLPAPVDADRVEASHEQGLLRLTLPKLAYASSNEGMSHDR